MLSITVPGDEFFDNDKQEFVSVGEVRLELEHSLVSLSKWESLWEKPFLGKEEKTTEEVTSYLQIMTITPDIPPEVFAKASRENLQEINDYINAKMTATWFKEAGPARRGSTEVITSELIYYWMTALNIPFECEHWHLNRLFTFIKVCNLKNAPPKKMGKGDLAAQRRALNEQRMREFGTTG